MDILERIHQLTEEEIRDVLDAVVLRFEQLYPQWKIGIFTLDTGEDTDTQIDGTIQMLKNLKTSLNKEK